ncbi:hypothetical protein BST81_07715 [Leptolyngbya sp. 'hensonii']|nr:hypothetical protein BST81_07715 [Leptolyngbya sp. 'hensonii']
MGLSSCPTCQTRLPYRYFWACGSTATQVPAGEVVAERYYVVAPQIWLDTEPGEQALIPTPLPEAITPYLQLYPQRLHVPEVFGFCRLKAANVLLLENIPLDSKGILLPSLAQVWRQTPPIRQVYWLWQVLQLWFPLAQLGVAGSLLVHENIRVEGWRIRLNQLYVDPIHPETPCAAEPPEAPYFFEESASMEDEDEETEADNTLGLSPLTESGSIDLLPTYSGDYPAKLQGLAQSWLPLLAEAQPTVATQLREICHQMQALEETELGLQSIGAQLNHLLLEQAAQLPLQLQVSALSDPGPQRSHNEDTCYPALQDLQNSTIDAEGQLLPYLTMVCDGIGGHEGGEVASQLAVQALKLQMQALLTEATEADHPLPPDLVIGQIQAAIRVVNNLIAAQNNVQGREAKQRMGTTLVMALQLPQKLRLASGALFNNSHELYLAHVGDSRAYWINAHQCTLLTVDDDVAAREVKLGRGLYRDALQRHDSGALTQALGTRDAEFLHPTVQRFILEEDGLLLLCSDGLSDNGRIEESWATYAKPVLEGKLPLEWAVQSLVELGNQKNGYDNTTVVMTYCRVSPTYLRGVDEGQSKLAPDNREVPLSDASRALLYGEMTEAEEALTTPELEQPRARTYILLGLLAIVLVSGAVGLAAWWQQNRLPPDSTQPPPTQISP